jgi:dihydrofolate synthase/folylpolyglutamate synthase
VSDEAGIVVCCRPPSPRALLPSFVAEAALSLGVPADRVEVVDTVADAVAAALLATPDEGQIVVTGSLYVVGAARSALVK